MKTIKTTALLLSVVMAGFCGATTPPGGCEDGAYSVLHTGDASTVQRCEDGKWEGDGRIGTAIYTIGVKATTHGRPVSQITMNGRLGEPIPFEVSREFTYEAAQTEDGGVDGTYKTGLSGLVRIIETEAGLELYARVSASNLRALEQLPGGVQAPQIDTYQAHRRQVVPKEGGVLHLTAGDVTFEVVAEPKA